MGGQTDCVGPEDGLGIAKWTAVGWKADWIGPEDGQGWRDSIDGRKAIYDVAERKSHE